MFSSKLSKKFLITIFVILFAVLPVIFPLFAKGFFVTDDGEWMIIRFSAFYQALRDGQFPVRFPERLNFGYGYPASTFLYPGFMYLAVIPHLLRFDFVESVKIVIGISIIGSFIFSYLWLKKFFNTASSFTGAIFYVYAPYHLYDLYIRGSVGEMLALAIIPFVFWQIERKSIFWSSVGIALLIISHNSLAALFIPLIILYMLLDMLIVKSKRAFLIQSVSYLVLGIGLSAFFWIPSLFELQYTDFSKTTVSNFSEYFASYQLIGGSTLLIFIMASSVFLLNRSLVKKHRLSLMFLIIGIISIFLASSFSNNIWKIFPISFIQFPFRILSITILCSAFLAGFIVSVLRGISKTFFIFIILVLVSISTYQRINKIKYFDKGDAFYSTNEATTTVMDEYMPVWVKEKPTKRKDAKVEIINGVGSIENVFSNNKKTTFDLTLKKDSVIQINTIYWPGWSAFVDEREVQISYNNPEGVMRINAAKGEHKIRFNFGETMIRFIGNLISIVSFVALCVIAMKGRKDND